MRVSKGGRHKAENTFLLSLTGCTWLYDLSLAPEIYWLIAFHFSLVILFIPFVFSLYHFFALGRSREVDCTVVPLPPALQRRVISGDGGLGRAVEGLVVAHVLLFSAWVSSSAQGGFKEEEKLCLSICNRKLFYHLNVVKLIFNKNCQSWTSQSDVPGDRADAGDNVIPGKLFHLPACRHSPICQKFDRADTWWLLGVGDEKKDFFYSPSELWVSVSCDLPRTATRFLHGRLLDSPVSRGAHTRCVRDSLCPCPQSNETGHSLESPVLRPWVAIQGLSSISPLSPPLACFPPGVLGQKAEALS